MRKYGSKHLTKIRSHAQKFVKMCGKEGYDPNCPTAKAVMHYLSIHSEDNGSAKSLGQVLSNMKVAYE